jgi:hypothetical protein
MLENILALFVLVLALWATVLALFLPHPHECTRHRVRRIYESLGSTDAID